MLDFANIQKQLTAFSIYQSKEFERRKEKLALAQSVFKQIRYGGGWEVWKGYVPPKPFASELVAEMLQDPTIFHTPPRVGRPLTVVATDGSQIYPDRNIEPACYLLNASKIAFHYGTLEKPVIATQPVLRYREQDKESFEGFTIQVTHDLVSMLRDQFEIRILYETALENRVENRPIVALGDGTLIRWMITKLQNPALEHELIRRYVSCLNGLRNENIPYATYISQPNNTEVVHWLEAILRQQGISQEKSPLEGLLDRQIFEEHLEHGERTALFGSTSHVMDFYGEENKICYFYVSIAGNFKHEIARVEIPKWVAENPILVDQIHAIIIDQAKKGNGYPNILSEAHEAAIIREKDKEAFYKMLNRQLIDVKRELFKESSKYLSKRQPLV